MKHILFFALAVLCVQISFSQKIVRSTLGSFGPSMKNGSVLIQQTVGQPSLTSFIKSEHGSLRQGFHQPFYYETERNELNALIFPNPNNGQFGFQVNLADNEPFKYTIVDQSGKEVLSSNGLGNQLTSVSINQPATGLYHLQITSGKRVSSFKISIIH